MPGCYDGSRTSHRDGIHADSLDLLVVVCNGILNCSLHVQGFTKSKSRLGTRTLAVRPKIECQHVKSGSAKESTNTAQILPVGPNTVAHHDERRSLRSKEQPPTN